jgi:hypothetical protein
MVSICTVSEPDLSLLSLAVRSEAKRRSRISQTISILVGFGRKEAPRARQADTQEHTADIVSASGVQIDSLGASTLLK